MVSVEKTSIANTHTMQLLYVTASMIPVMRVMDMARTIFHGTLKAGWLLLGSVSGFSISSVKKDMLLHSEEQALYMHSWCHTQDYDISVLLRQLDPPATSTS